MKETIWRAKRLTREMQSYWKRYDRVERETRRRLEKEAEEQRKMDVEMIEVLTISIKLTLIFLLSIVYTFFKVHLLSLGETTTKEIKLSHHTN